MKFYCVKWARSFSLGTEPSGEFQGEVVHSLTLTIYISII